MAIIDSGLGWSADENYMAQYSGVVLATISGLTGGVKIPYVANDADVPTQGLYVGSESNGRSVYLRADDDTYDYILLGVSETGNNRGLWIVSTANGSVTRFQYNADMSLRTKTALTGFSTISGTDLWRHTAGYSTWDTVFSDVNPYIPIYTTYAAAVAACAVTYASITKAQDGYCVLAYVSYKWEGGYGDIDETPVLISTLDAATEITGLPTGVTSVSQYVYYQGAIFRMTFLYNLEGAARGNILPLDYTTAGELSDQQLFARIAQSTSLTVPIAPDPYGGGSGPGGGTGGGPGDDTPVPHPTAPTISAVDTGLVTLYVPTLTELQNLSSYLWSGLFDVNTFRKIFADPMDAILGLMLLPIAVPAGSSVPIRVGNQNTTVSAARATMQYVPISCGSITLEEDIGCYLDYDPYTQISMYLPYVGFVPLKADDCMRKTLSLQYIVDCLTGACVATLAADGSVIGSWAGNCATQIPITGQSWNNVIAGALSVAATAATLAGGATAVAPLAVANMANTAINSQKPTISRSGSLAGSAGFMGVQIPYLIVTRPRPAIPGGQNQEIGYPSYINELLSSLQGYTIVDEIHLAGITGTKAEIDEIQQLLAGGVIL